MGNDARYHNDFCDRRGFDASRCKKIDVVPDTRAAAATRLQTVTIRPVYASDLRNLLEQATRRDGDGWLMAAEQDAVRFLRDNERADWIVIYASFAHLYLHSVLAPKGRILDAVNDPKGLMDPFPSPTDGWRINYSYNMARPEDIRIGLEDPLAGSALLQGGEQLVFRRSWAGDVDADTRTEINQKLVHCLDLYEVEEREAFCRLDERGDPEDVIRITHTSLGGQRASTIVSIRRQEFHEYATLADMGIVTHFDFNRYKSGHDWRGVERFDNFSDDSLFYEGGVEEGFGSYVIGRHIVIPALDRDEIARRFVYRDEGRGERAYVTFKVKELRSDRLVEASCDPAELSNYFEPDPKFPHELSPAFFRAEVLSRYKADTEKYALTDHGEIHCRGSWRLRSYDVNDAGQVHVYLVDLNKLPHEEQVYWSSFNEWPKGDLSERAIHNDFRGELYPEYDPLHSLKLQVEALDANPPVWWKLRGEELGRVVHLPATDAVDEWANAILSLDQLVVEGLLPKPLRRYLSEAGREFDTDWGSLKLVQECLIGKGMSVEVATKAVAPLREVHRIRTVVRGHAAPRERISIAKTARKEHGTLRSHFEEFVSKCDSALTTIRRALGG